MQGVLHSVLRRSFSAGRISWSIGYDKLLWIRRKTKHYRKRDIQECKWAWILCKDCNSLVLISSETTWPGFQESLLHAWKPVAFTTSSVLLALFLVIIAKMSHCKCKSNCNSRYISYIWFMCDQMIKINYHNFLNYL